MPDKPAFDLTNSNISDTFTGLIQVRDTDNTIYDGVGDRLNDFRVSGSFTTSDTITSNNLNSQTISADNVSLIFGDNVTISDGANLTIEDDAQFIVVPTSFFIK